MSTVAGGDTILAADNNDLENRIAQVEGRQQGSSFTANVGPTVGTTELAIDQITFNIVNGVKYRIDWNMNFSGTVNGDQFFVLLRFGAGIAGTQITFRTVAIGSQFGTDLTAYFVAASTTALTITGTVRRNSGTGTMTVAGSATQPRYLMSDRRS